MITSVASFDVAVCLVFRAEGLAIYLRPACRAGY
jgi:uncharacterized protein YjeT (DUF2065 family)